MEVNNDSYLWSVTSSLFSNSTSSSSSVSGSSNDLFAELFAATESQNTELLDLISSCSTVDAIDFSAMTADEYVEYLMSNLM